MYENFKIERDGFNLVGYEYKCENPKYVVVLIHGIGEHMGRYQRVADYFNRENIAVMGMDLRGHGKSDGKRGHAAPRTDILKDIDSLMEYAIKNYSNVPIVMYGHSMGGNITIDYRARGTYNYLPKGYIISAPWIKLVRSVSGGMYKMVEILSKICPSMTISSACKEEDLGNLTYVRPYNQDPLVHPKISLLCAYEGFTIGENIEKGKNLDNGRSKDIPCLLMHGDCDKICSIEASKAFAKLPKNSDNKEFGFIELEGYCHEIHNGGKDHTGETVILKAIEFIKNL